MDRAKRLFLSVGSGYVFLLINGLYTLLTIPLALRYLPRGEFGAWSIVLQVATYLALADLGMSGAFSRYIIEHKDDRSPGGGYSGMVRLAARLFRLQGTLILAAGAVAAPFAGAALKIPPDLTREFGWLLVGQCGVCALGFYGKIYVQLLYAHQRIDLLNHAASVQMLLNAVLLWAGLREGWGAWALLGSGAVAYFLFLVACWVHCRRLGFLPGAGETGAVPPGLAREVFFYGLEVFFMSLGTQTILASQVIVAGRTLGVEAAALWTVMLKPFTILCLVVWRVLDYASPALAEMLVRGEEERLRTRYRDVLVFTACLAGIAAIGLTACNGLFVGLWTSGKMAWPWYDDALLGVWLVLVTFSRCFALVPTLVKKIGAMRFVYFLEGGVFLAAALCLDGRGGFAGILLVSIVCTGAFSGFYGLKRAADFLAVPRGAVLAWCRAIPAPLALLAGAAGAAWFAGRGAGPAARLSLLAGIVGAGGIAMALRVGMARDMRDKLLSRLPWRRGA